MINIKVHNGDDIQVYSFEKDTPPEDIKAALIADKNESSTLNIEEEVRSDMREVVESNPIRPLLDLVASKEASIHGYNQTNGPKNRDNLTEMTFAEVIAKQDADYYMNKPQATSNAVGRYQFIPKTLKHAMDLTGLSPDDVMNEENQDKMAAALLEKRKLSEFLSGEIDAEQFAEELSKEWAAFPVMEGERRGESRYEEIGNNTAHLTPDEMLDFLGGLKEFGPLFVPSGGGKVTDVIAEQFERIGSDTPRHTSDVSKKGGKDTSSSKTTVKKPSNLQSYEDSTVQKGPQSSQERAGGSFANIAVPKPTPIRKAPERFRTSSIAEEATALQAASAKAPAVPNVPMPVNPMEGMTDDMNPLLKGVPYEPGSMGRV